MALVKLNVIQKTGINGKMNNILDDYWPWGTNPPKPRGLRNLRLDGIFPNNDLLQAKRLVGPLDLGRLREGAPMPTKIHPLIRFQWNKDLRKCVDNTLRYKTDRKEAQEYKRQLDAQVADKELKKQWEKQEELDFYKKSGWSTENTLRCLAAQPTIFRGNYEALPNKRRLSPLKRKNVNGEELVPLLARQRSLPQKIPLGTTDVTRGNREKKKLPQPEYLQELSNQVDFKKQKLKEKKENDMALMRRHFEVLDTFWGRPGHGAPRTTNTNKKGCLERLLYNCSICA